MKTLAALDVLKAEALRFHLGSSRPPGDAAKECRQLIRTRNSLQAVFLAPKLRASRLNPDQAWRRFESAAADLNQLDSLEVRTICLADDKAVNPRFVRALRRCPERLNRLSCLRGMVNSYFKRWRTMEAPDELENLLRLVIAKFPRPLKEYAQDGLGFKFAGPRSGEFLSPLPACSRALCASPLVEQWRKSEALFSPQSAYWLAELAVEQHLSVEGLQQEFYVGKDTRLGLIMQARVAELATGRFLRQELTSNDSANLEYLRWLLKTVFTGSLVPGALHDSVSSLILSNSANKSQPFQDALRQFIQRDSRLGDPRLQKSALNWQDMNPLAMRRVVGWLAERAATAIKGGVSKTRNSE